VERNALITGTADTVVEQYLKMPPTVEEPPEIPLPSTQELYDRSGKAPLERDAPPVKEEVIVPHVPVSPADPDEPQAPVGGADDFERPFEPEVPETAWATDLGLSPSRLEALTQADERLADDTSAAILNDQLAWDVNPSQICLARVQGLAVCVASAFLARERSPRKPHVEPTIQRKTGS
jgi:hypothetical protein